MAKRRLLIAAGLLLAAAVIYAAVSLLPLSILPIQQKPEVPPQKAYDYYLIIDVESDRTLMYVPLLVHVGDEVISEENKRYQVVRIEENRAYARFVENVDIEKYKPK
jgi:hypothetical protein